MQIKRLDPAAIYYLNPDAQFLRPRELLGPKGAAEVGEDNYVLSCPSLRARAKVVSERIRSLLQRFRAGARVSEAILAFAREHGEDPRDLLTTYLPVLQDLQQWNYLSESDGVVPTGGNVALETIRLDLPGYQPGRVLKRTADSVVCEAFTADGVRVCVKQLTAAAPDSEWEKIVNEAKALRVLAGLNVPEILAFHPQADACSLVTSWAGRHSAREAFAGALGVGIVVDGRLALRTAVAILRTFEAFHARGVLHSDIHHNNLRFQELGRCRVIDFGLAFVEGSPEASAPLLEAVAQYLAPEQLPAYEADHYRRPDRRSEQYSLAALLYYLLSDAYYLDFRLETSAVIPQIKSEPPRPLVLRNGEANAALDAVFRRALSKEPSERFASLRDFADALESAARAAARPTRAGGGDGGRQPPDCVNLLSPERAIRCQGENFGLAGCLNLALTALGFASLRDDPIYLDGALIWAAHARRLMAAPEMFAREVETSARRGVPLYVGATSLHELPVAAELALFAIDHAVSGMAGVQPGLEQSLAREAAQTDRWDFVAGQSGLLNALSALAEAGCTEAIFERAGRLIAESLTRRLADFPVQADVAANGFGLAHGRAGVIYALLRWRRAGGETADETLRTALREFVEATLIAGTDAGASEAHGGKARRFGSGFAPPSLSWWCNGLSGITGLLDLANQAAPGAVDAPALASVAMTQAWECAPSVRHVCCGHAGVALGFWQAARLTGDRSLLATARRSLDIALANPGGEMSLLKGDLGIMLVAEAMHCERRVSVPLFIEL